MARCSCIIIEEFKCIDDPFATCELEEKNCFGVCKYYTVLSQCTNRKAWIEALKSRDGHKKDDARRD